MDSTIFRIDVVFTIGCGIYFEAFALAPCARSFSITSIELGKQTIADDCYAAKFSTAVHLMRWLSSSSLSMYYWHIAFKHFYDGPKEQLKCIFGTMSFTPLKFTMYAAIQI